MSTVDVESLLGELAEQRKDRAGISTTTLNVVAFVEEDEAFLERLTERTNQLAERHAARTVLLVSSHKVTSHTVHSRCNEVENTLLTHSEQLQIGVSGVGGAELRSIAHALTIPNVRTVLLWGGRHIADERFTLLAELANVAVIFSSATSDPLQMLRELVALQHTPPAERVRDIAYLRLNPWQDLIAQFFDDDELTEELTTISRVEVVCGSAPEAYYLVGWLASRLHWDPCGPREFCNAAGARIEIDVRIEGAPRRVRSVSLRSAQCVFGAAVENEAEELVCLTVEGRKHRPQRCLPLHDVDMIALVERAIFADVDSEVYAQTLAMAGRVLEQEAP